MNASDVLAKYVIAQSGDASDVADLYAAQTRYIPGHTGRVLLTPSEIHEFESRLLAGYSKISGHVRMAAVDGNLVAAVVDWDTTHIGTVPLPDGTVLEATNRILQLETAEFIRIDDEGKIAEHVRIFDSADMRRQLVEDLTHGSAG